MLIKHPRSVRALSAAFLLAVCCLVLLTMPSQASANQLIVNGSFKSDLGEWEPKEIAKGVALERDDAGHRDSGSALFTTTGRSRSGETHAVQSKWLQIDAGGEGRLEFSWKKNWSTILPAKHTLYIDLVKPDTSVERVWENKVLLNDNTWRSESIDIGRFLNQKGAYSLILGASFENGKAGSATTYGWFDDIRLEVAHTMLKGPKTSFIAPAGSGKLAGSAYPIHGVAIDDIGIADVYVAVERLSDRTFWNGSSWVKEAFWNEAELAGDGGRRITSWSYVWPLPTSDGAAYRIYARAENITDNLELIPVETVTRVDNVGPTGGISIEGEATHANTEAVRIDLGIKGATKMRFSTDDARSWSDWEDFVAIKKLTLPKGDGTKVVSAQFKDDSGNNFQISDSIVLDMTAPVTRHIYPAQKARNVSPDSSVGIVFYEKMAAWSFRNDGTEIGSTLFIKQGSRWIAADVDYSDKTKTAKLVPHSPLDTGTTYTVYLTDRIKDKAGNSLAANFSWEFTTSGSFKSLLKETVGAAGGAIHSADRLVSLEVPEGALAADTVVTVEELRDKKVPPMKGMTRYSPIYQLTPKGLPFSAPVTLRIKYKQDEVHNPTELRLIYFDEAQEKWLPVQNAAIDLVNNQITAKIAALMTVTVTAQDDASAPSTSIVAPTGASELTGRLYNIFGVAHDNSGVARVELSIRRQSDNAYWSGSEWRTSETWLKAKVAVEKDRTKASWSYRWQLPDNKFTVYEIRARAADKGGNIEASADLVRVRLR